MNTFLPYSDFKKSAACLDKKRLWKQCIETLQLIRAIRTGEPKKIRNHPACKMWVGYEYALITYGLTMCEQWRKKGYKESISEKLKAEAKLFKSLPQEFPVWLGNPNFHKAMRSNLLRKKEEFYRKFGWTEPTNLPYIWGNKDE